MVNKKNIIDKLILKNKNLLNELKSKNQTIKNNKQTIINDKQTIKNNKQTIKNISLEIMIIKLFSELVSGSYTINKEQYYNTMLSRSTTYSTYIQQLILDDKHNNLFPSIDKKIVDVVKKKGQIIPNLSIYDTSSLSSSGSGMQSIQNFMTYTCSTALINGGTMYFAPQYSYNISQQNGNYNITIQPNYYIQVNLNSSASTFVQLINYNSFYLDLGGCELNSNYSGTNNTVGGGFVLNLNTITITRDVLGATFIPSLSYIVSTDTIKYGPAAGTTTEYNASFIMPIFTISASVTLNANNLTEVTGHPIFTYHYNTYNGINYVNEYFEGLDLFGVECNFSISSSGGTIGTQTEPNNANISVFTSPKTYYSLNPNAICKIIPITIYNYSSNGSTYVKLSNITCGQVQVDTINCQITLNVSADNYSFTFNTSSGIDNNGRIIDFNYLEDLNNIMTELLSTFMSMAFTDIFDDLNKYDTEILYYITTTTEPHPYPSPPQIPIFNQPPAPGISPYTTDLYKDLNISNDNININSENKDITNPANLAPLIISYDIQSNTINYYDLSEYLFKNFKIIPEKNNKKFHIISSIINSGFIKIILNVINKNTNI
jgi:hypothetical protein